MLELHGAGFGYSPQNWVFKDLSFSVPPGTVTAVLGPNGSGKTTLVRCAAGMLAVQEAAVRRSGTAGYVPQARGSTFGYPVLDMVVMGRARHIGVFRSPGTRDRAAALHAPDRSESPPWPSGCFRPSAAASSSWSSLHGLSPAVRGSSSWMSRPPGWT